MKMVNGPATPGASVSEVVVGDIIAKSLEVFINGVQYFDGTGAGDISVIVAGGNTTIKVNPSRFDLDQNDEIVFKFTKLS